jgi:ribonucrease Y
MPILPILAAGAAGLLIGYQLRYLHALSKKSSLELTLKAAALAAEEKALKTIERAEAKAKEIEDTAKAERKELEEKLNAKESRLDKKEEVLDERHIAVESEKEAVRAKIEEVKALKTRLDERKHEFDLELARIAGLSKEAAYHELLEKVQNEQANDLQVRLQKLALQNDDAFAVRAQNILLTAIHRIGNNMPTHFMTANVELPSEEIKGKIIGKEGRNVRAFERITGVDVLVDETPGYVTLSSFDPIRREIARVALETLMKDGRIQPARIEEVVDLSRKEVAATVRKMGEKACFDVGVTHLHPDLVAILGRLYFRTSYGQNVLAHSVEVAHLAGIIAEEVGADVAIAKAGALLHDIGKTVSHEVSGTHVEIGIRILQKYDVDEKVILAMRAHHEEYPYETPESVIVQVADALSGARPGARRDSIENYIKRLTELEAIATDIAGVQRAFAISAGREIRVMVNPDELSDLQANQLARQIAMNIEAQLRYPGEIKVHVIREMRVISYAR